MTSMYVLLTLATIAAIVANTTGDVSGFGGDEAIAGGDQGFRTLLDLPTLAYPAIAAVVFVAMLLVTLAFRSTNKRH